MFNISEESLYNLSNNSDDFQSYNWEKSNKYLLDRFLPNKSEKKFDSSTILNQNLHFYVLKKGRKKISDNSIYYKTCHNKYSKDIITTKIQVHYISFICKFINIVLEQLNINLRFKKINYEFKKSVNKKHILKLKNLTIGEILCQEISPKYTKNTEKNKKIFEKIKNIPIIENILSSKYLDLFNIYKEGKDDIKFKNLNINLSDKDIEVFQDFKQKNINDLKYGEKVDECIKKYINEKNDQIINNKKC